MITDSDGRIQGFQEKPDPAEALSDLANCMIYVFERRDLRLLPGRGRGAGLAGRTIPRASSTGRWTSSRSLLEADVPFYIHEIDAYWNDVGNLASCGKAASTR